MPNFKTHATIGTLTGGSLAAVLCINEQVQEGIELNNVDWKKVLTAFVVGGFLGLITSSLPDIFEPGTNPFHRKFFHSFSCLVLLTTGVLKFIPKEDKDGTKKYVLSGLLGYGSHIILDSQTPMGIPFK